jgi:hypothetical protein
MARPARLTAPPQRVGRHASSPLAAGAGKNAAQALKNSPATACGLWPSDGIKHKANVGARPAGRPRAHGRLRLLLGKKEKTRVREPRPASPPRLQPAHAEGGQPPPPSCLADRPASCPEKKRKKTRVPVSPLTPNPRSGRSLGGRPCGSPPPPPCGRRLAQLSGARSLILSSCIASWRQLGRCDGSCTQHDSISARHSGSHHAGMGSRSLPSDRAAHTGRARGGSAVSCCRRS